jgi:hypothetical protein
MVGARSGWPVFPSANPDASSSRSLAIAVRSIHSNPLLWAIGARSPSLAVATTMHHFSVASLVEASRHSTRTASSGAAPSPPCSTGTSSPAPPASRNACSPGAPGPFQIGETDFPQGFIEARQQTLQSFTFAAQKLHIDLPCWFSRTRALYLIRWIRAAGPGRVPLSSASGCEPPGSAYHPRPHTASYVDPPVVHVTFTTHETGH